MKRILILLLASSIFVVGCSVTKIDENDITKTIDTILNSNISLSNINGYGYKYYLPKTATRIDSNETNEIIYADGSTYYLYIDDVAYYNKVKNTYVVNDKAVYSKLLNYNDISGYIEINEVNGKSFIEMVYNYSKVETYVSNEKVNEAVINIAYILSSVRFNDEVIKSLVGDNPFNYKEERFNLFEPRRKDGSFLDIISEFEKYNDVDNELPDTGIINDSINKNLE